MLYSLFFILYSLFFILYSLFFILYSLFFILYSLLFAFDIWDTLEYMEIKPGIIEVEKDKSNESFYSLYLTAREY